MYYFVSFWGQHSAVTSEDSLIQINLSNLALAEEKVEVFGSLRRETAGSGTSSARLERILEHFPPIRLSSFSPKTVDREKAELFLQGLLPYTNCLFSGLIRSRYRSAKRTTTNRMSLVFTSSSKRNKSTLHQEVSIELAD